MKHSTGDWLAAARTPRHDMPDTERLDANPPGLRRAIELLRKGALVAFPTETVYGLGGIATRDSVVTRIYDAKRRPRRNPLILHVPTLEAAKDLADFDEPAETLAKALWRGPLTLVLPLKEGAEVSGLALAGLKTVAIRVPAQPLAQALLRGVGQPVAAPSANPSGKMSPTTADHVIAALGTRIAAVLDGGPCPVGLESTIVMTGETPTLLRPGGIPGAKIAEVLGAPLADHDGTRITAPGQLLSHYAPENALRLNAEKARDGERLLGFGDIKGALNLSETGDLAEAATNLFRHLHTLDAEPGPIAVAPIPEEGLGVAINDRLQRAAALKY